ncbi:unnamed protein product, partial [Medioppia subpectinata]
RRHVCQLQRITFKFCKTSADSKGIRQFIETDLVDWSRANSGVVVYLKPRRHRSPVIVTEYLNGLRHWMGVRKFTPVELEWWLDFLRDRSGYELSQLMSPVNVMLPSVQGPWHPFLNRDTRLNVCQFPDAESGAYLYDKPTASQQLIQMSQQSNTSQ